VTASRLPARRAALVGAMAVALTCPLALATAEAAPSPRPAVQAGKRIPDQYIVTFARNTPEKDVTAAREGSRGRGAKVKFTYSRAVKGFAATMSAAEVHKLRANPNVVAVEPDFEVHASDTTQNSATWGLDRIDQKALPLSGTYTYGGTGAGVTAYVIDSGIRMTHQEFGGRASAGFTAISDGRGAGDCAGHGTHVAGTIGGATYGVA
jgi:subtilisin family serine protease